MMVTRATATGVSALAGLVMGTCVFLGAKVIRPPETGVVDPSFYHVVGSSMPSFRFRSVTGREISSSGFLGGSYFVFVGDPLCDACKDIYPMLAHRSAEVPLIAVTMQEPERMQKELQSHRADIPVVLDTVASIPEALGITEIPTVVKVDKEGVVNAIGGGVDHSISVLSMR